MLQIWRNFDYRIFINILTRQTVYQRAVHLLLLKADVAHGVESKIRSVECASVSGKRLWGAVDLLK